MATKIGAVVYVDSNTVFRIVYPLEHEDDTVLDELQWVTVGVDANRRAVLIKLDAANPDWGQFSSVAPSIDPRLVSRTVES